MIKDPIKCGFLPDGRRLNKETAGPAEKTAPLGSPVSRCSTIGDKAGRGSCRGVLGGGTAWRGRRRQRPDPDAAAGSPGAAQRPRGARFEPDLQEDRVALGPRQRQRRPRSARGARGGTPTAGRGAVVTAAGAGTATPPHPPRPAGQAQAPPPSRSRPLGVIVKMQPAEAQTARCRSKALRRRGRRAGGGGTGFLTGTIVLGVVQTYFPPSPYRGRPSEVQLPATHMSLQQSFPATSVAGGRAPALRASSRDSCTYPSGPPTAPSDQRGTKSEPRNLYGPAHVPFRINLLGRQDRYSPLRDYSGRCPRRER